MCNIPQLSELQRDTITELLNIGMGQAAASLGEMVDDEVKLSLPSMEILSRRDAAYRVSNDPQQRIVAIKQHFEGPFWGDVLLLFPQEKSLELVKVLMNDNTLPLDTLIELEHDALLEIANIILNSCLGSLGNILTQEVTSDLPTFMSGIATNVLNIVFPGHNSHDIVMFLRMDFAVHSKNISGYVAFILELPSIEQFTKYVDSYLASFECHA